MDRRTSIKKMISIAGVLVLPSLLYSCGDAKGTSSQGFPEYPSTNSIQIAMQTDGEFDSKEIMRRLISGEEITSFDMVLQDIVNEAYMSLFDEEIPSDGRIDFVPKEESEYYLGPHNGHTKQNNHVLIVENLKFVDAFGLIGHESGHLKNIGKGNEFYALITQKRFALAPYSHLDLGNFENTAEYSDLQRETNIYFTKERLWIPNNNFHINDMGKFMRRFFNAVTDDIFEKYSVAESAILDLLGEGNDLESVQSIIFDAIAIGSLDELKSRGSMIRKLPHEQKLILARNALQSLYRTDIVPSNIPGNRHETISQKYDVILSQYK